MTNFTPGPWQIREYNWNKGWSIVETVERGNDIPDEGYDVALVYDASSCGNANLIAAAPAMYEALNRLVEEVNAHKVLHGNDAIHFTVMDTARTALKLATGGNNV